MKAILFSFVFTSFLESGLFNELRSKKDKNPTFVSGCAPNVSSVWPGPAISDYQTNIALFQIFVKSLSESFAEGRIL
jgi:hypothetical protein